MTILLVVTELSSKVKKDKSTETQEILSGEIDYEKTNLDTPKQLLMQEFLSENASVIRKHGQYMSASFQIWCKIQGLYPGKLQSESEWFELFNKFLTVKI